MMSYRKPRTAPARVWRRLLAAVMTAAVVSLVASQIQAGSLRDAPQALAHGTSSTHTSATTWAERDGATYVVSTLNLPRCEHGRKLPSVLRQHGARLFDVLRRNLDRYLYFIEVRKSTNGLLAVYAYALGSRLPTGVRDASCVRDAPPAVIDSYRTHDVVRVARFSTTVPE